MNAYEMADVARFANMMERLAFWELGVTKKASKLAKVCRDAIFYGETGEGKEPDLSALQREMDQFCEMMAEVISAANPEASRRQGAAEEAERWRKIAVETLPPEMSRALISAVIRNGMK